MIGKFVDNAQLIIGQLIGAAYHIVEAFLLGGNDLPDQRDLIVVLELIELFGALLEILITPEVALFQR